MAGTVCRVDVLELVVERFGTAVRSVTSLITARWSSPGHSLGVGLGVASGFVTVGVIGSASRLEYTAVGPAVNLASRLCEQASDGEVLEVHHLEGEVVAGVPVADEVDLPVQPALARLEDFPVVEHEGLEGGAHGTGSVFNL